MKIKELKMQLEKFDDNTEIIISDWKVKTTYHTTYQTKVQFPTIIRLDFDPVLSRVDLKTSI